MNKLLLCNFRFFSKYVVLLTQGTWYSNNIINIKFVDIDDYPIK